MRIWLLITACAVFATPVLAEDAHHPEETPPAASAPRAKPAAPAPAQATPAHEGSMMSSMHEMMERMHKASTREERDRIMAEHKAAMKQKMAGGDKGHGAHK